jgi:hypothetical protein
MPSPIVQFALAKAQVKWVVKERVSDQRKCAEVLVQGTMVSVWAFLIYLLPPGSSWLEDSDVVPGVVVHKDCRGEDMVQQ